MKLSGNVFTRRMWSPHRRLIAAMGCYGVLAGIALYEFLPVRSRDDRYILGMLLFVIAFLAVKTLMQAGSDKSDEAARGRRETASGGESKNE